MPPFDLYGREAAVYVQDLGLKTVAVVFVRLSNSRPPFFGGFVYSTGGDIAMTDQPEKPNQSDSESNSETLDTQTQYSALLETNTLLSDDVPVENARAVLRMLGFLDIKDECLGEEGAYGLYLILEWIRRSLAYTGNTGELAIPLSGEIEKLPSD